MPFFRSYGVSYGPEIVDGLKRFIDTAVLIPEPTDKHTTKEAVSTWMERRHNWHVEPEWILNPAGVVLSIFSSVEEFTKSDEGVIIFTPYLSSILRLPGRAPLSSGRLLSARLS